MERRTPVFIICSPLPQVGKTLIARLLVDYLTADERQVAAFDVNPDDHALAAQLPEHTAIANIDDTKGQMALFDQLIVADETAKVVDLGYACFDRFFTVMQEIGYEAEAQRRSITLAVLFIADASPRSSQAYAALQERFPALPLVPVLNSGGTAARSRSGIRLTSAMIPLQIPPLPPALQSLMQWSGVKSTANIKLTSESNRDLQAWTRRIFLQFRELELRLLLETLKPALKLGA